MAQFKLKIKAFAFAEITVSAETEAEALEKIKEVKFYPITCEVNLGVFSNFTCEQESTLVVARTLNWRQTVISAVPILFSYDNGSEILDDLDRDRISNGLIHDWISGKLNKGIWQINPLGHEK